MGVKLTKVPKLNPEDLTERETLLWQIIRELQEKVGELTEPNVRSPIQGDSQSPLESGLSTQDRKGLLIEEKHGQN